jgi:threo-3-hydroxy-L-aspartate ammonia-lyase
MSSQAQLQGLVEPGSIREAHAALAGVALRTPLLPAPWLQQAGAEVRLKCENLQAAGAFKIRGAYTALHRLPADVRDRGVIAYSSGNHAQGVALAARLLGTRAVVVMPTTAPRVKVDGTKRFGAEVVMEGTTSLQRQQRAEAIAAAEGLSIIPAFDHPDIIAGQGTVGLEILEQWADVDVIVVPVGGGGLLSGIAAWVKHARPEVRVIGVEPDTADAMRQSLDAGHPVTIPPSGTVADGLMPVRPGDLTFQHARALVDDVVCVSDDAMIDATRRMALSGKLVAEFSGAATVAALVSGVVDLRGARVAAVVSGGNIEPSRLAALLSDPPLA